MQLTNKAIHSAAKRLHEKQADTDLSYFVRWEKMDMDRIVQRNGSTVIVDATRVPLSRASAHRLASLLVADGYSGVVVAVLALEVYSQATGAIQTGFRFGL